MKWLSPTGVSGPLWPAAGGAVGSGLPPAATATTRTLTGSLGPSLGTMRIRLAGMPSSISLFLTAAPRLAAWVSLPSGPWTSIMTSLRSFLSLSTMRASLSSPVLTGDGGGGLVDGPRDDSLLEEPCAGSLWRTSPTLFVPAERRSEAPITDAGAVRVCLAMLGEMPVMTICSPAVSALSLWEIDTVLPDATAILERWAVPSP